MNFNFLGLFVYFLLSMITISILKVCKSKLIYHYFSIPICMILIRPIIKDECFSQINFAPFLRHLTRRYRFEPRIRHDFSFRQFFKYTLHSSQSYLFTEVSTSSQLYCYYQNNNMAEANIVVVGYVCFQRDTPDTISNNFLVQVL